MPKANLPLIFLEPLSRSTIRYMVTGSVAAIFYGEPRTTHDVDLVIDLDNAQVDEFMALFPATEFYRPPSELVRTEILRQVRGHFNLIHHASGFKADLYPVGRDPLHHWAMERRRKQRVVNVDVWVAPPEYVILRKLEFYREGAGQRHLRDIRRMLDLSSEVIDHNVLEAMIQEHGLLGPWKDVQAV